jgi:hypothetical protein
VVGRVRSMAVETPWGALVRMRGAAAVAVALFRVFCRAAQPASGGTCAGARVVPHPAAVALDHCGLSGHATAPKRRSWWGRGVFVPSEKLTNQLE